MRKPDFFIVGAPKCATTALDHYLSMHPDICMAQKEMHYFGSDLTWRQPYFDRGQYLRQFADIEADKTVGESSVWYLYSKNAAREIFEFQPDAKIIVMFRNPLQMLPSLHAQLVKTGDEDILSFEEALAAEPDRRQGLRLPATNAPGIIESVFYLDVAAYGTQLARYFRQFGEPRIHTILYDDFQKDSAREYAKVLKFLKVDSEYLPDIGLDVVNKRLQPKHPRVWRSIKFAPEVVKQVWRNTVPASIRERILQKVTKEFFSESLPVELDLHLRTRLIENLRLEIEQLAGLLERDLTHWLRTS